MRNNEPVFFSTWGFKYAPPVNIDDVNLEKVIKDYLSIDNGKTKTFIAMKTYLITEKNNSYDVYAWVLEKNYYQDNNEIIEDSASSIPYKFEIEKIDSEFIVKSYIMPRDGSYYYKDMKKIFPSNVLKEMDKVHTDSTIERLELEIKEQVELYFHE